MGNKQKGNKTSPQVQSNNTTPQVQINNKQGSKSPNYLNSLEAEKPHFIQNKPIKSQDVCEQKQIQQELSQDKNDLIQQLYLEITQGSSEMKDEQFFNFLSDRLEIQPDDKVVGFIMVNVMKIQKIQKINLTNFRNLFEYCDDAIDISKVKTKIPQMSMQLKNQTQFKKMYLKLHQIYSGNKTTIDMEVAEQLWIIYLKDMIIQYDMFQQYLQSIENKQNTKVHKDLWKMILSFTFEIKDISTQYSQQDGWPLFIDNFVQFVKQGNHNS